MTDPGPQAGKPRVAMTIADMRREGTRFVIAECRDCRRKADLCVDALDDGLDMPGVAARLKCSGCGSKRVETRPAWHRAGQEADGG